MPVNFEVKLGPCKTATNNGPDNKNKNPTNLSQALPIVADTDLTSTFLSTPYPSLSDLNDMIQDQADEEALRALYQDSQIFSGISAFLCGGTLRRIRDEKLFLSHGTFADYCNTHFGLSIRSAEYYMKIHDGLSEAGMDISDMKSVSYSKLRILVTMLPASEIKLWLNKAEELTCTQLSAVIKAELVSSEATEGTIDQLNADESEITSATKKKFPKSFSFYDDQYQTVEDALEKIRSEMPTQFDNVAIEHICLDYLGGVSAAEKYDYLTVTSACQRVLLECDGNASTAIEIVLTGIKDVFPDYQIRVDTKEDEDDK